jgi:hypothetical protein
MVVKVIRAANEDCWYSKCIGMNFHVFNAQGSPYLFFSFHLFFFPCDVINCKDGNTALVPVFSHIGIS